MSKKFTTEKWIVKAKNKHSDRYDYSLVDYINNRVSNSWEIHTNFR